MKRRFIDALDAHRCVWTIKLGDGSTARCGRAKTVGQLCTQHSKIEARLAANVAKCSSGNDEHPHVQSMNCGRNARDRTTQTPATSGAPSDD